MAKSGQSKPEVVTVYGKISKDLAARLDRMAEERRWSRAQMVAYCIEQFIEGESQGQKK